MVPAYGEFGWVLGTPTWHVWRVSYCLSSCLPQSSDAQGKSFPMCPDRDSPSTWQGASCCCPFSVGIGPFLFLKSHCDLGARAWVEASLPGPYWHSASPKAKFLEGILAFWTLNKWEALLGRDLPLLGPPPAVWGSEFGAGRM